jgi:hypothetical protein
MSKTLHFLSKLPSPTGTPEPTIYGLILATVLSLAVSFGLSLTEGQSASVVSFVNLLAGLLIRQHVSPAK